MTAAQPELDLSVEDDGWLPEEQLAALARRALAAALNHLGLDAAGTELSLVFTDDEAARALNAEWRGQDKPTNVLSFPAFDLAPGDPLPPVLGDIVLARETVEREAALDNKPFDHHLTHLVIHGFLHLLGYDHLDEDEAEAMESLETAILEDLGISDPYGEPDAGSAKER
ncbi:rRNA maturation RNase YbeY [Zhengella mangrovi]|uniref:Endoribonuclease YbeY n=1 Tax=Zhengella mangrovi TaxID=1982044 RepID=A0A2G1QU76_9HYPH|nr:rRNA maturation RNase YbeY [Zhengella mangrovi]PHP69035.1 rRNA maturation RNase YbeY [Zhengella mangrovi]